MSAQIVSHQMPVNVVPLADIVSIVKSLQPPQVSPLQTQMNQPPNIVEVQVEDKAPPRRQRSVAKGLVAILAAVMVFGVLYSMACIVVEVANTILKPRRAQLRSLDPVESQPLAGPDGWMRIPTSGSPSRTGSDASSQAESGTQTQMEPEDEPLQQPDDATQSPTLT